MKEESSDQLVFQSVQQVLDFSTSNWTIDFITTDLRTKSDILPFVKRPWFVLVFLQARLIDRWNRIHSRSLSLNLNQNSNYINLTFEQFVIEDDLNEFGIKAKDELRMKEEGEETMREISERMQKIKVGTTREDEGGDGLRSLMSLVTHSITNDLPLTEFLESLGSIHVPIMRKSLRPCWDTYFTSLANLASLRSNCMKRRVGAVLVTKDNRILSTGYNGTARGMINCNEGGCTRCNGSNYSPNQMTNNNLVPSCGVNLEECLCLHAEENALLEAGRDRITNSRLYCNTCPCLRCTIKIVQCGVQEVIYSQSYSMDQQAKKILLEAGIKLRQFN